MTPHAHALSTTEAVDFDPFSGAALARAVPTTEAQREVWLADRLGVEASLAYDEAIRISLEGPVDVGALERALGALLDRHEALRSTFSTDGRTMLIAERGAVTLEIVDLTADDAPAKAVGLDRVLAGVVEHPFDLAHGPLFRATLVALDSARHELVLAAHHIVCDGWSFGVLVADLARLYDAARGIAVPSLQPAARYGDYAARELARRDGGEGSAAEAFWSQRFSDDVPVLDLPVDRPRPAMRGFASRRVDRRLDASLASDLKRFAGQEGTSLFGLLAGAFAACISRIAGQSDVVVGIPAAGQSASGMRTLVGHCVNLLPVRFRMDGETNVRRMLASAQSTLLDAFEHQEFTFGTLLRNLRIARDPARLPLVSVMFNLDQKLEQALSGFTGLSARITSVPRRFENFELFINATWDGDALVLECQYGSGLFDAATIESWLGAYESMLRGVLADPEAAIDALPMIDDLQASRLQAWNDTTTRFDRDATVVERFLRQAARTPHAPAVLAGRERLTYGELGARASRIAHALRARGVRHGTRVGLCLERGTDLVASLLAVHAAGAAYVPLDPGFPTDRLDFMATDAGLSVLVTEAAVVDRVSWPRERSLVLDLDTREIDAWPAVPPAVDVPDAPSRGEEPAYVIHTSGSTGKPKGVVVPHRAVGNFLESMARTPGLDAEDRLVAVTTLSFDIAVLELLLPLTVGASVVVASREDALDGTRLRERLESTGATVMQATPASWRMLIDAGWQGRHGFKALVGGEALPADLAAQLLERCDEVWNMYGPTETTVWSTTWRVRSPERGIVIGRPIANTRVEVRDANGRPVAIGVPGELWIGGDGVALGYHDRPDLTADRFVADIAPDGSVSILYRTGDRGRWRADGLLEHLGRLDTQVKVRGFRIELGEIEAGLRRHPGIEDAVAIVREDRPGDVRLVAYCVPRASQGSHPGADVLAAFLGRSLPAYMIPQHFVTLPAVPRLPNGKLDRRSLPAPDESRSAGPAYVTPATETERLVAGIMEKALGMPGIGRHDDFFALGGHSLLAAQVIAGLNRQLGLKLSMRALFESPTVERLGATVDREAATDRSGPDRIPRRADRSTAPLSLNQERLWFLERLQPNRTIYNTPSAHRLVGRLDVDALGRALQGMVDRHEVLRTAFEATTDGGAVQRIDAVLDVSRIPLEDLTSLPDTEREAAALARIEALIATPFDLSRAPLCVVRLFRMSPEEHWLLFMPHHAVWDGWSFDLFYEEMSEGYLAAQEERPPRLPTLEVSYGDFAAWQQEWVRSEEFARRVGPWRDRLAADDGTPRRPLMTDRPRGALMTGEGRTEWLRVDRASTERLRELGRSSDATLFMTLLTAYAIQLSSLGALGRRLIGIPVRGRSHAETEPLAGYFTNLLPVQVDLRPNDTFRSAQSRVREALLDTFALPDVPIEHLMPHLPELHGTGPLYQALFSFQDARRRPRGWGNLRHERIEVSQQGATEDVGLWLVERPDGLVGGVTWNADLFETRTAIRLKERFLATLQTAIDSPDVSIDALLFVDADERRRLEAWWAGDPASGHPSAMSGMGNASTVSMSAPQRPSVQGGTAPATVTERRVADTWRELLGIVDVRREDNFFDLGGHSLLVMRAAEAMERALGRRIDPRRYVFESLAQIAAGYDGGTPIAAPKQGFVGRILSGLKRG